MKNTQKPKNRRKFLKHLTLSTAAVSSAPHILARSYTEDQKIEGRENITKKYAANDLINLALIGSGIQGIYDTNSALRVDGVKLVAACDLYDGRHARAKELWGKDISTTRDYRDILKREDVDAVIVATPDHWHRRISVEAMKAGKAVYCEKPMIQKFDEGKDFIKAQNETGKVLQVGSQGMSSLGNEKAKQLYEDGAIGEIVMLDMFNDRYSSEGAWQYPIPPDANPNTVEYDTFLGSAPKTDFDLKRFFRWRNYRDYGTGVAGDLFVHAFSTLHYVISSHGPVKALSTGGLRYWKDGRDVPDVTMTFYDYPETKNHAAFNAAFRVNFIAGNGGGYGFKLVGTEGEMHVGQNSVKLVRSKLSMVPGGYSLTAYTKEMQEEIRKEYEQKIDRDRKSELNIGETNYEAPNDYKGGHYDHFYNFFQAIRGEFKTVEDATFGFRAAGAALLANESYYTKNPVNWDPEKMELK